MSNLIKALHLFFDLLRKHTKKGRKFSIRFVQEEGKKKGELIGFSNYAFGHVFMYTLFMFLLLSSQHILIVMIYN
jgi:hypothetical protein